MATVVIVRSRRSVWQGRSDQRTLHDVGQAPAVSLAAQRAQPKDLDRLEITEAAISGGTSSSQILHGVDDYLTALILSAHEPILSLFGTFLAVGSHLRVQRGE